MQFSQRKYSRLRNTKKIETKVTKSFQEHLLIFADAKKQEQIWQLVVRHPGKPSKVTETRYHISQDPELLYQRAAGIFFELDEEEHINIIDVTKRVADNFHQNNERVTKQFYDKFKQQHTSFLKFIKGIDEKINQEWYASLMLNRLMFCYFIQKKGFLDDNKNYLSDKLKECQEKKGKDKFYSFYRSFLLQLFHDGLGAPDRSKKLTEEIGKIPYLNGGLFDEHELEKNHSKIEIDDKAFESIFKFFNEWEWHLDTRHTASGKDINPDVIGYIFEKYINDRADMGAYYTKEDITDYISKNCILPFLFDETKRQQPKAFNADAEIWKAVKESSDKYIYDAVKKGAEEKLPKEIADGIKNISARTEWNKTATESFALPTEIWREVVDRRNRYTEIKTKIEKGEVTAINDFITYNLNIRQFAIDTIANTNDPDFLKAFYKSLNSVTIIDPTCGSGAFLFAAMNILEELYEACLQRMKNFIDDCNDENNYKHFSPEIQKSWKSIQSDKSWFRQQYAQVTAPEHPNLSYFIYKNIILQNLYGVDIMKEAVEIAKLRLFLKLVSTVEADYRKPNLGLEPLPDIDFNIRSGNTLIGFATEAELDRALTYTLDGQLAKPAITEKIEIVAMAYRNFKNNQVTVKDYKTIKTDKQTLEKRLKELNYELNLLLHKQAEGLKFEKWLNSYLPFHWFAEFYEIVSSNKGFDIIIGNPPYVEYAKVRDTYRIKNYETEKCANLYGFIIERSNNILNKNGIMGMIIPISAFSNSSMETLQILFKKFPLSFVSNYHQRPAALFEGVLQRLSIFIAYKENIKKGMFSTIVYRWKSETRNLLFNNLSYTLAEQTHQKQLLKIGNELETTILKKYLSHKEIKFYLSSSPVANNKIFYRTAGGGYWVTILNTEFDTTSLSNKSASFRKEYNSKVFSAVLNSNLFWWYYSINFDQFNFKDYMIFGFRFNFPTDKVIEQKLIKLSDKLEKELLENATSYVINSKTRGSNETITYNKSSSKYLMDEIDNVLAGHYGFTEQELNFIVNYDIKYRMSKRNGKRRRINQIKHGNSKERNNRTKRPKGVYEISR